MTNANDGDAAVAATRELGRSGVNPARSAGTLGRPGLNPAGTPAMPCDPPLLTIDGAHKWYGGVHALRGASFSVPTSGRVVSLLGENGSGKSTLLGILSGQIRPDQGVLFMRGEPVHFQSPVDALRHGIAMVSQETAVAPSLTVAENILLGHRMPKLGGSISWSATRRAAQAVLDQLGLDYDPGWTVGALRPDQQQLVEICRAVSQDARVLILDEPTSSLSDDEVEGLFATVRQLRAASVSVVFVSHRISEVLELSDDLTIMCDGRTTSSGSIGGFDAQSIVAAMVGGPTAATHLQLVAADPVQSDARVGPGDPTLGGDGAAAVAPRLRTDALSVAGAFENVNVSVHPGEIVGLAGLVGSGRSDLLETLFGMTSVSSGEMVLDGRPYRPSSVSQAISRGVGFLPPDRKLQGLVLRRPISDNIMMAATNRAIRVRPPRRAKEAITVGSTMTRLGIRARSAAANVATLSGGNQQKVAIGKWLASETTLALLDEPTRGVDVAAKAEIHDRLKEAAQGGLAMLVSSSEYPELLALCDRILVMYRGRVVADGPRSQFTETLIARLAGGHHA
jgi:ABC-type sugar transport system ATPase subunit